MMQANKANIPNNLMQGCSKSEIALITVVDRNYRWPVPLSAQDVEVMQCMRCSGSVFLSCVSRSRWSKSVNEVEVVDQSRWSKSV